MIVIDLTPQVATDAELKALDPVADQSIVWHTGKACAYMYRQKLKDGDIEPDTIPGYWVKENLEAHTLEEYKVCRYKEIDERTGELVLNGFVFAGKTFSLSLNAQINIEALNSSREDPALSYPITYNTLDDLDSYDIPDAATLHGMYLTALATKKGAVDSGTALKQQVRTAATAAEVEAIIDNR